jgi:predicted N-acyltransferase
VKQTGSREILGGTGVATSSGSRSRKNKKKHYMINSLSKEDYSFFYENSVWEQYEDFTYALSRGKEDLAKKLFKKDGITIDEALRPVRTQFCLNLL